MNLLARVAAAVAGGLIAAAAQADVNIGVILSLTGPGASLGIPAKNTVELWPKEIGGQKCEPIEYLVVEAPTEHSGSVMRVVLERQGECMKMENHGSSSQMEFFIPARGLIGLRTRMMTATQGTAVMHHNFHEYRPVKSSMSGRPNGVLISSQTSKATGYAILGIQERGLLFVGPMEPVYEGQIVGENARDNDLTVNVTREKALTNMRSVGADKTIPLKPPVQFSMEMALEYIEDDELVEITPENIRMRKIWLKENERKKNDRGRV